MRSIRVATVGCALAVLGSASAASAASVEPIFVAGNPSCVSLGYDFGFKVDPPNAGTYSIDGLHTVTVVTDGVSFDWSSTLGMDAVIAKGGPNANVYVYDPPAEATSDTGLHSPINPSNGQPFGLSHIELCFDYEVTVTKDARTSFTRTYHWSVDKSVAPELWTLFQGDAGTSQYTVRVDRTGHTDSAWAVAGTITIFNDTPFPASLASVADVVSGGIAAAVDCGVGFPFSLASLATLECSYQAALPDGSDRTNTASATSTGTVGGGSGSAPVTFGSPTTEVNASVTASDSNGGSWSFSDSGSVQYTRTFSCDADQGVHGNTVTLVETGQSDDAAVAVQCDALQVAKTARTALTRTWDWTIDKVADQTELLLSPGQQFLVDYTVTVDSSATDGDWRAFGDITVHNPNPLRGALLTSVADLAGASAGEVSCGVAFPHLLATGGTLACTYTLELPSGDGGTNTATATLQNFAYAPDGTATPTGATSFTGSAAIDFASAAVTHVDECVDVTDTLQGALGTLCADAAPGTFSYSRFVGPYVAPDGCGEHQVVNTASFAANDTPSKTGEDSATVDVTVPCGAGCTLTPGYWKTHSRRGPAPYDDAWAQLGPAQEGTPFFLSGQSYYQVLWQAPQGNAYSILAHAWIATTLNGLDGASLPPEVQAAWDEATTLFQTWTPAQIGAQKGGQQPRKRFLELAGLLDMYNNGLIGPGHCSE